MQVQEQISKNSQSDYLQKCAKTASLVQKLQSPVVNPGKDLDELLAALITARFLALKNKKFTITNSNQNHQVENLIPKPQEFGIKSTSKTLAAFLSFPHATTIPFALTYIQLNSKDVLEQLVLENYSEMYTCKDFLKIPLLTQVRLTKALSNLTFPLILKTFASEKNAAVFLDENNLVTRSSKKYQEFTTEEQKTLTGALVRTCLDSNCTLTTTRNLVGKVYFFETFAKCNNSIDLLEVANSCVAPEKRELLINAVAFCDLRVEKKLQVAVMNFVNLKKASVKLALRRTSDFGKFWFLDLRELPSCVAIETAQSLQSIEKYCLKPLVMAVKPSAQGYVLKMFKNCKEEKSLEKQDFSTALKEITLELSS